MAERIVQMPVRTHPNDPPLISAVRGGRSHDHEASVWLERGAEPLVAADGDIHPGDAVPVEPIVQPPVARVANGRERRNQRALGPADRHDLAIGLHQDVGQLLPAGADVGGYAAVTAERVVEPAVPQETSDGGPAGDAVGRRTRDHDATRRREGHGVRRLEPPAEACDGGAAVREPGVERAVRPVALYEDPVGLRCAPLAHDHDPAVGLDRQVEGVVVRPEIRDHPPAVPEGRIEASRRM